MTSNKQFEELMESVNSGILVVQDEIIVYANNYIAKRFGASKSELVGKHILDFIHTDKSKEAKAQLKSMLYSKNPILGFETDIINAKGETRIVEINSAQTNFRNTPARIFSIKDITESRDTERDLTNSSKHFELLFNSLPYGGEVLDLDGIIIECSPSTARMLEYTESEIIGKHVTKILAKESIPIFKELFPKLINGEAQRAMIKMVTKSGKVLNILRAAQPLFDDRGKVASILALNTDITEQKQTEQLLNEVGDIAKIGGWEMDLVKRSAKWTKALYDIIEIDYNDEVPGPDEHLEYYLPTYRDMIAKKMGDLVNKGIDLEFESEAYTAKGRKMWCRVFGKAVGFDESGKCIKIHGTLQDITKEKSVQKDLVEKELFQESLLNATTDVIYIYDFIEQKNIYSNNSIGEVLGYSVEEIQKFDNLVKDLMHPDDFKNYIEIILPRYQTVKDNELIEHEYRMRRKDGEWHWFLSKEHIYNRDSKGNATQIFGVLSDITERKNTISLLEEKERHMRSIYDDPNIFIGVLDIDGRVIGANKPALDFIDKNIKDVSGVKFWDTPWWSHSKDQQKLLKSAYKKALQGTSSNFDAEHVSPNSDSVIVNFSIRPIKDSDGKIIEFLIEGINITEQVSAEEGLRVSEKRYRALSENAPVGVWHADIDGNVTYINPKLSEISGLTSDEATGGKWGIKVHPEDRDRVLQEWNNYIAGKKPYTSMYRFVHDSGEVHWALENATTIFDDSNKKIAHIGTITDITDRKEYENELLTEKNYGVQLVDSLPGLFYEISTEGRFTNWNKNFEKITGYTSKEFAEMNPTDFFEGKEKKYIAERIGEVFNNGYSTAEAHLVSKKGERTPYFFTGNLVTINEVPRLIGMGIDISEQKVQEKKLIESENKFRSNLEEINLLALMLDSKGKIVFANDFLFKKTGWKRKEVLGKNYFDIYISKDVRPRSKRRFKEIIDSKSTYANRTNEMLTKDGERLIIDWNVTTQYDDKGKLIAATSIGTDITDKLKIESDLRFQSELIKQSYESMITTDLDFKISWTNEAFTKLFGYKREEVLGRTPDFLNAEPMSKEIQQGIYESMQAGKLLKTTLLNKKKDGSTFVCEVAIYPVMDKNGKVAAYSGHQYDVTERVTAQKELQSSEEKYHDLFEHQLEAYAYHEIILNKKGKAVNYKFLDVNDQFLKELNIKSKKDVVGKTLFELDPNIDKKWVKIYGEVALTGKPTKFEDQFAQNGKWYKIYAYSPKHGHFATSFIDISDEKRAEGELKEYKDLLEERVEKRTTELQKKNEELDNALKVFVGRELTIKNLRNEISKLEKEIKKLKN